MENKGRPFQLDPEERIKREHAQPLPIAISFAEIIPQGYQRQQRQFIGVEGYQQRIQGKEQNVYHHGFECFFQ